MRSLRSVQCKQIPLADRQGNCALRRLRHRVGWGASRGGRGALGAWPSRLVGHFWDRDNGHPLSGHRTMTSHPSMTKTPTSCAAHAPHGTGVAPRYAHPPKDSACCPRAARSWGGHGASPSFRAPTQANAPQFEHDQMVGLRGPTTCGRFLACAVRGRARHKNGRSFPR